MKQWKSELSFALWMMPVTAIAYILVFFYQAALFGDQLDAMAQQVGGIAALGIIGAIQTCITLFLACFFGRHLAEKLGLWRTFSIQKQPVVRVVLIGLIFGGILLADHFVMGGMYPEIQQANRVGNTLIGVTAAVAYGGIVEELLMRLFVMSFLCWFLWKLFARKEKNVPEWALLTGNILAAVLFAAGHLPATVTLFGGLDVLILLRCLLLNGIPGFCFGLLYKKYGLQYAILCHMACHLCFKLILWIVL